MYNSKTPNCLQCGLELPRGIYEFCNDDCSKIWMLKLNRIEKNHIDHYYKGVALENGNRS